MSDTGWGRDDCGICGEAWEDHRDRKGFACPEKEGTFYSSCAPCASLSSPGDARADLNCDDVEWVVNDLAELGVKIGDRFFFLYKGHSLVYGSCPETRHDGLAVHDDGTPMRWRHVLKREFGECAHPINWKDPTKIGTVNVNDGHEWRPLPAPAGGRKEGDGTP